MSATKIYKYNLFNKTQFLEMELRDFEEKIISEFHPEIITPGKGKAKSRLGWWIRGHLQDVGEDYPYHMWERWISFCSIAHSVKVLIPKNNYTQFAVYMGLLETNKLIKVVREEPKPRKRIKIKYYSVVEENIDGDLWINPRKASSHYKKWSELPEEKKEQYRKSRHLKAALSYAEKYGIPLEEVPDELRGRRRLTGIPRKRE